ncbi:MAG TPA: glycosyltransferase family 4 protein [Candidatus Paceibacterota bacterium]
MRILFITTKLNFETAGGSIVDLHLKAVSLGERGHEVSVLTIYSSANHITFALPYNLIEEHVKGIGLVQIQSSIYRILRKQEGKFDVICVDGQTFLYGAGLYRLLGGKTPIVGLFNRRLSSWSDSPMRIKAHLRLFLEKTLGTKIANKLDAFVFGTPQMKERYQEFGIGLIRDQIIPNAVSTRDLGKRYSILGSRKEIQSGSREVQLFAAGRMIPEKRFDLLLNAFAILPQDGKYKLTIAGNGAEFGMLNDLAKKLGIEDRVTFPGWTKKGELFDKLNHSDIFIFPGGKNEYSSVLLSEAMAFALPCIVPGDGALEWQADGGALVFNSGDAGNLAAKIELLSSDHKIMTELSEKAYQKAMKDDYHNLADILEELLKSVQASVVN